MEHKIIKIDKYVYDKITSRAKLAKFESTEEYINFVLKEVLANLEKEQPEQTRSKEDEEKVKERLKALGYLD